MVEPSVSAEECRAQAVAWFLSSEKTIAEIAHTLKLSESTVRQWVWNATPEDSSDEVGPDPDGPVRAEAETRQAETVLTDAVAVEAVIRAETIAAEAVARAEAVATEAKAAAADLQAQLEAVRAELETARSEIAARIAAEAAAREEAAAVYAEAVEAIVRAEAAGNDKVAWVKAAIAEAVAPGGAADAASEAAGLTDDVKPHHVDRAEGEAEARAKIAEVMAQAKPVELWIHATGRTLKAATAEILDRLGVDEEQADIEVLANGSRWLPSRVHVRGRVRGRTELRLLTKSAGPGPVASAGPGPADGRG